ncbi:MAG: hypothetical protein JSR18_02130 [Proteobacteria bacterium]|nr:hypothetical protein [Pseudomonadota bacterium]
MSDGGKTEDAAAPATAAAPGTPPALSAKTRLVAKIIRLRGPITAIAAVGATLGGFVGYWNAYRAVHEGTATPATAEANAAAGPLSIVVLPFTNLTGDADQGYFADGLTATLASDLSRIPDAFVIDSASAQSYKGKPLTAQQIGRALGVRFVLQGSVQRNGSHIRINAQLADATTNAQIWADSFEGDTSDLFALQDKVTARIAASMDHQMVLVAARESEKRRDNPNAVDLLLRARALQDQPQSLDNWRQVERLYRQALAVDPGNTKAMMGLASALSFEATNFSPALSPEVRAAAWQEAVALATEANSREPDDPDYYRVMAFNAAAHDDVEGERRAAEAMVRLDPRNPSSYNVLSVVYLRAGEPQKAVEVLRKAVDLNRKNAGAVFVNNLGRAYFLAGDNKSAIVWADRALQIEPTYEAAHVVLAMAYALDGNEAKARAEASEVRRLNPRYEFDAAAARARAEASPVYRNYLEQKIMPGLRGAGLAD